MISIMYHLQDVESRQHTLYKTLRQRGPTILPTTATAHIYDNLYLPNQVAELFTKTSILYEPKIGRRSTSIKSAARIVDSVRVQHHNKSCILLFSSPSNRSRIETCRENYQRTLKIVDNYLQICFQDRICTWGRSSRRSDEHTEARTSESNGIHSHQT